MTTPSIRYNRAPSEELLKLLMPGGFLAPVVALNGKEVAGVELDVHFRECDEVHVYCGRTTILRVKLLKQPANQVSVDADERYKGQPCADGLFRQWSIGEHGFATAIDAYLSDVKVGRQWTGGEGAIQSLWARVTEPWVPFDREVVLGYESRAHRAQATVFPEVDAAFAKLMAIYEEHRHEVDQGKRWAKPKKTGRELDQIAVDCKGRLVLIEIKDGSKRNAEVYYSPFQLLQYVWEWHSALVEVLPFLQKVIDDRVASGLTPKVSRLTGKIRAAVCFGADTRSPEVKRRYAKVLEIVNKHLPPGVDSIETWALGIGKPLRLNLSP